MSKFSVGGIGGRHAPSFSACSADTEMDCPAAERILADFMSDYDELQESLNHE